MADIDNGNVIAVLTDAFAPFHRLMLDALHPHFAAAGYSTLCVTGRDISYDRFGRGAQAHREEIRALALRRNVSGVVIVSGATPPGANEAEIAALVRGLTDGPAVSLGEQLPGVPSSVIRWQEAIEQVMAHMTSNPRHRRFAFIRGYANDPHSVARESGFRAGLAAAGLEVDEKLVVCGNYATADAMLAVDDLIRCGHEFDGVIAANDDMACGAIAALNRHGFSVPDDVIVSGFDDAPSAFTSVPQLTTALLDTQELAEQTATLLLDAIDGRVYETDHVVEIRSRLIVRGSSGVANLADTGEHQPESAEQTVEIESWEPRHAPPGLDVERLVTAISDTALTGSSAFNLATEVHRTRTIEHVAWWRHVVRKARRLLVESDQAKLPRTGLRAVLKEAHEIDRWLRPIEVTIDAETQSRRELQERLIMQLSTCTDAESLWNTLREGLHHLEMANAWVTIQDDRHPLGMRLAFSLDDRRLDPSNDLAAIELLPHGHEPTLAPALHVLVPLRAGSTDLGHLIIEPRGEELIRLEAIASGVAQVLRHLGQVRDLERQAAQLRDANIALDQVASTDSLTGLPNRKAFIERLDEQLNADVGGGSEVVLLFLDLDGFKVVNDNLGHNAGDELLQLVATRVTELLHHGEMFARLGGDEFTVVIRQHRESPRASELAEAIVEVMSIPFALRNGAGHVSVSIGVAQSLGGRPDTDDLIGAADTAMYYAKRLGKNRIVYADEPVGQRPPRSAALTA